MQILAAILKDGDIAALQRLFVTVMEQARARGYGEVIDDWGEDMAWMLGFSPQASAASRHPDQGDEP